MDQDSLPDLITIEPEPFIEPDFYYRSWSDALSVSFPTEPSTKYTITVAPGEAWADAWLSTLRSTWAKA